MVKLIVGEEFEHSFRFTQNDVVRFAEVTGDKNPIHLDADYASQTQFKRPILQGFLSGSVFSKVFGTIYPGEGTIYLMQELVFKRPMFAEQSYVAKFAIEEIDIEKHTLKINCSIADEEGRICLEGGAKLLNNGLFSRSKHE